MTARARIPQDDMTRVLRALKDSGVEKARIRFDLVNQQIEVMMGESPAGQPEESWDDEDT